MINIFMIPQRLPKEVFVSTRVLIFTWINWIKMPFFLGWGLVTLESLKLNAFYLPLLLVGVWLGVWLNKKIPEDKFRTLTYALVLLAGLHLIFSNL